MSYTNENGATLGTEVVRGRPAESIVMLEVRPTGLVVVQVAGGPTAKARVHVLPLTTLVSVSATSGVVPPPTVTARVIVVVEVNPEGSLSVVVEGMGASMPKRGSALNDVLV